ncbi:MAG: helix-turn-helix domain-containing protein [Rhodospirillaceae bacterium]|nr:helix-turn-helix domain-containing protein [Rhodospirillaceae bacterium]
MSGRARDWAANQTVGNALRKAVLNCLCDFHNARTGRCDPTVETIAAVTEMDESTVRRNLKALEHAGFLKRELKGRRYRYLLGCDFDRATPGTAPAIEGRNTGHSARCQESKHRAQRLENRAQRPHTPGTAPAKPELTLKNHAPASSQSFTATETKPARSPLTNTESGAARATATRGRGHGRARVTDEPAGDEKQQMLTVLRQADCAMTRKDFMAALSVSSYRWQTYYRWKLDKLIAEGLVVKSGRGMAGDPDRFALRYPQAVGAP